MGGKNFDVSGISGSDLTLTSWAGKTRVRQGERGAGSGEGREGQPGVLEVRGGAVTVMGQSQETAWGRYTIIIKRIAKYTLTRPHKWNRGRTRRHLVSNTNSHAL